MYSDVDRGVYRGMDRGVYREALYILLCNPCILPPTHPFYAPLYTPLTSSSPYHPHTPRRTHHYASLTLRTPCTALVYPQCAPRHTFCTYPLLETLYVLLYMHAFAFVSVCVPSCLSALHGRPLQPVSAFDTSVHGLPFACDNPEDES